MLDRISGRSRRVTLMSSKECLIFTGVRGDQKIVSVKLIHSS